MTDHSDDLFQSQYTNEDIDRLFSHHPPGTVERIDRHAAVRSVLKNTFRSLNHLIPDGDEKRLVKEALEVAMYHANAAVARQPQPELGQPVEPSSFQG